MDIIKTKFRQLWKDSTFQSGSLKISVVWVVVHLVLKAIETSQPGLKTPLEFILPIGGNIALNLFATWLHEALKKPEESGQSVKSEKLTDDLYKRLKADSNLLTGFEELLNLLDVRNSIKEIPKPGIDRNQVIEELDHELRNMHFELRNQSPNLDFSNSKISGDISVGIQYNNYVQDNTKDLCSQYLKRVEEEANSLLQESFLESETNRDIIQELNIVDLYVDPCVDIENQRSDSPPSTLLERNDKVEKLLVVGGPGAGKSAHIKLLAYIFSRTYPQSSEKKVQDLPPMWTHGWFLPVIISVPKLLIFAETHQNFKESKDIFLNFLNAVLVNWSMPEFWGSLKKRLEEPALIMFDALDDTVDINKAKEIINGVCKSYVKVKHRYIVSSRPTVDYSGLIGFECVRIREFGEEQSKFFVEKWCKLLYGKESDKEHAQQLLSELAQDKHLEKLAQCPLIITLIMRRSYKRKINPSSDICILDSVVRLMLQRTKTRSSGSSTFSEFSDKLLNGLRVIAYHAYVQNKCISEKVRRTDMRDWLKPRFGSFDKADEAIQFIVSHVGLLVVLESSDIAFSHHILQEFLAASYVNREKEINEICEVPFKDYEQQRRIFLFSIDFLAATKKTELAYKAVEQVVKKLEEGDIKERCNDYVCLARYALAKIGEREHDAKQNTMYTNLENRLLKLCQKPDSIFWILIPMVIIVAILVWRLTESDPPTPHNTSTPAKSLQTPPISRELTTRSYSNDQDHIKRCVDNYEIAYVYVPSGQFLMGSTTEQIEDAYAHCNAECQSGKWFKDETPQRKVKVDAFWIMEHEVSFSQYKKCVDAHKCERPQTDPSGPTWIGLDSPKFFEKYSNYAVTNIPWDQADTYANWVGGSLPTESQWEMAARGTNSFIYPWGDVWKSNLANYCDIGCNCKISNGQKCPSDPDHWPTQAPVGQYPQGKSLFGAYDMAGNLAEWVADLYPGKEGNRIVKGGSWKSEPVFIRSAYKTFRSQGEGENTIGFRIVKQVTSPDCIELQ